MLLSSFYWFMLNSSQGEAGDNMGALLRGVKREQMKRGQVIIAPGSMKPTTKFQAQIYVSTVIVIWIQFVNLNPSFLQVLTKDEGMLLVPMSRNRY